MRAKEFITEVNYRYKVNPTLNMTPDPEPLPLDDEIEMAVENIMYQLRKGEARDIEHASSIASCDIANRLGIEQEEVSQKLKTRLDKI